MKSRYVIVSALREFFCAILVAAGGTLFAQDVNQADINTTRKKTAAFFNLSPLKCSIMTAGYANNIINNRLNEIELLKLIPLAEINRRTGQAGFNPKCSTKKCAQKLGKLLKADLAIYGSITSVTVTKEEKLGDSGADKYLIRTKNSQYHIIQITLIDIQTSTVLSQIEERIGMGDMQTLAYKIKKTFEKHILPNSISLKK